MSEELKTTEELNLVPLDTQTREVAQQILDETDVDKVKDLTNLFNLYSQKRNVMRVVKMNHLLDKVTDKVVERFEKTPDNFSNDDLIRYMQVTENAIDRANKQLNLVDDTPAIQLQQNNQVNVNIIDGVDRESRERIAMAVKAMLMKASGDTDEDTSNIIEGELVDDNSEVQE